MEWIEITGRTVAEAVDSALDELGVDESDMEFEVLEEPRRGLFGLRATGLARIRARVKPISREKPDRRRRTGQRDSRPRGGGGGGGGGSREAREPREPRPPREAGDDRPPRPAREPRPPREPKPVESPRAQAPSETADESPGRRAPASVGEDAPAGERVGGEGGRSRSRNRRRGGSRGPSSGSGGAGLEDVPGSRAGSEHRGGGDAPRDDEESSVTGTDVSLEEQVELAEIFTRGLVERFGLPAIVTARADGDDDVMVDIDGDDLGLLIGPRAATLDAVQELVRTSVQRRIGGHGARVHVDVGGYRARRQAALAEFAREAAQRALESGRPQVFEPMSAGDRKVVHDTVNEIEGVQTVSEGEEPRRRVVIKAV